MMPIGIPKVAYRIPGAQQADWVDIYNRMYRERIIFLGQEIDDEFANQIIGVMLYLDQEDSTKPIYLYINWYDVVRVVMGLSYGRRRINLCSMLHLRTRCSKPNPPNTNNTLPHIYGIATNMDSHICVLKS